MSVSGRSHRKKGDIMAPLSNISVESKLLNLFLTAFFVIVLILLLLSGCRDYIKA